MDKLPILRRVEFTDERPHFDCGDKDLNEFFAKDSVIAGKELLSVTYIAKQEDAIVAFFSVSNDSIKKENLPKSRLKKIPHDKRYLSLPAVKIGRLACSSLVHRKGIGTLLLDFIKVWFTENNKTGCRFIVVDAYNEPKVINFYEKNGFGFLLKNENPTAKTRLMYFDLITFRK